MSAWPLRYTTHCVYQTTWRTVVDGAVRAVAALVAGDANAVVGGAGTQILARLGAGVATRLVHESGLALHGWWQEGIVCVLCGIVISKHYY